MKFAGARLPYPAQSAAHRCVEGAARPPLRRFVSFAPLSAQPLGPLEALEPIERVAVKISWSFARKPRAVVSVQVLGGLPGVPVPGQRKRSTFRVSGQIGLTLSNAARPL